MRAFALGLLQDTKLMKIHELNLNEGVISFLKNILLKKKNTSPDLLAISPEQRKMIAAVFPNSNADVRYNPNGAYVLPHNVHAGYGRAGIAFYNEGGQLIASLAHYGSEYDRLQNSIPTAHTTHPVNNINDLLRIRDMIT